MSDQGRGGATLAALGLGAGATLAQVTAAHAELVAYLGAAPRPVRAWARQQLAEVEAAYAELARELKPRASAPNAKKLAGSRFVASDADDVEDLLDALDDGAPAGGRAHVTVRPGRAATSRPSRLAGSGLGISERGGMRRLALGAGVLAIALVGIVAIYKLGEPTVPGLTGTPAPGATAAGVDQAQVVALMEKLATNPRDVTSLRALADLYYAAGDNATSRSWLLKVLEVEPKNVEALLGAGATAYNLDDFAAAETSWRAVIAIDPKNVDAHYDLGLMYFSKDPPDLVRMREEWTKVIEIAPDSELASIVRTHMPDASGSPGPAGSPGATSGASPAASPS
jgi:tetratricopeptide (TPR) repeat protein